MCGGGGRIRGTEAREKKEGRRKRKKGEEKYMLREQHKTFLPPSPFKTQKMKKMQALIELVPIPETSCVTFQ
jgi:hypothetical protein